MKKLVPIIALITVAFTSCYHDPEADFSASNVVVEVGEDVFFTNYSDDVDYFEWDFGDGYISNDINPVHYYDDEGTYSVTLSAFLNGRMVDQAFMTIEVLYPTTLVVSVLEYYDEYAVSNAEVTLYTSLYDWENMVNPVATGYTDRNGDAVFEGLTYTGEYFIDVFERNHNNYTLKEEDIDFIRTTPLLRNGINYFTAWVDYVGSVSYENQSEAKIQLKKAEVKTPRKFSDKEAVAK